jgi:hypothetical protein
VDEVTAGLDAFERERALFALTSAYSLAEEMWIFKADPARPAFTDWMAHGRKTAGDSPYTVYLSAPVDATRQYRLRGNLGDATYFGIQIYRQFNGFNAPSGVLNDSELVQDGSGNFEVIVSRERPSDAVNWVPLVDGDYVLMTREYRYDPVQQRPAQISIERIDSAPSEPPPLVDRVAKAARYFEAVVLSTIEIASLLSVNQFSPPDAEIRTPKYGDSLFPTKATHYDGFFVKLEPGQAIKLSGQLPDKWRYVSFVFYDRWYATPDYPEVRCYLTGRDLQLEPDGSFTIYLSPDDPGYPNWIQMGKLREGLFSYRYMLADSNPKPLVEVVTLAGPL